MGGCLPPHGSAARSARAMGGSPILSRHLHGPPWWGRRVMAHRAKLKRSTGSIPRPNATGTLSHSKRLPARNSQRSKDTLEGGSNERQNSNESTRDTAAAIHERPNVQRHGSSPFDVSCCLSPRTARSPGSRCRPGAGSPTRRTGLAGCVPGGIPYPHSSTLGCVFTQHRSAKMREIRTANSAAYPPNPGLLPGSVSFR